MVSKAQWALESRLKQQKPKSNSLLALFVFQSFDIFFVFFFFPGEFYFFLDVRLSLKLFNKATFSCVWVYLYFSQSILFLLYLLLVERLFQLCQIGVERYKKLVVYFSNIFFADPIRFLFQRRYTIFLVGRISRIFNPWFAIYRAQSIIFKLSQFISCEDTK